MPTRSYLGFRVVSRIFALSVCLVASIVKNQSLKTSLQFQIYSGLLSSRLRLGSLRIGVAVLSADLI